METLSLPWLEPGTPFPPPESALGADSPWPGLLAGSESLNADMLLAAYAQGIFPWSGPEDPVLWWSTDPRMVLRPGNFRLHKSLRKTLQRFIQTPGCEIRIDSCFDEVMLACAGPRSDQGGTWITDDIRAAYGELY